MYCMSKSLESSTLQAVTCKKIVYRDKAQNSTSFMEFLSRVSVKHAAVNK